MASLLQELLEKPLELVLGQVVLVLLEEREYLFSHPAFVECIQSCDSALGAQIERMFRQQGD